MRWQEDAARSLAASGDEALALLEHPPVYTFGAGSVPDELLLNRDALSARGAAVVASDRGGRVTFHGPGQMVLYPVLDLRARGLGPADHVRRLETTIIDSLSRLGIAGERMAGRPGVWVDGDKIASIGVRVRRGITRHGAALNVCNDLAWFDAIVPCGIEGVRMTSVERVLGAAPAPGAVEAAVCAAFERLFESRLVCVEAALAGAGGVATW
jgi:lipoate-protein ligase B